MDKTFNLDAHDKGPDITAEYVLAQVDDLLIFRHYIGEFKLGVKRMNPLRNTKKGHLSIVLNHNWMKLQYKDWGTGEVGDCFKFISQMFGLTYREAIEKVACDFGLTKGCSTVTKKQMADAKEFKEKAQNEYLIQVDIRTYSKEELAYWAKYNIDKEDLIREKIYAIKTLWINKKQVYLRPGLHFAYHFPWVDKFKIYSPDEKEWKWFGNVSAFEMEGIEGLRLLDMAGDVELQGDPVIITKSRKDRIILKKLYHNVCNCQNEAETAIPKFMDEVFNQAEKKFCWFDSDEAGKSANRALNHRGYKWINVPNNLYEKYGIKDPADVIEHFGWEVGSEVLINELKKKEIL